MDTIPLPPDFKDLLRSLRAHGVRYLLIGGYAVIYHGYVRSTGDMDIWVGPGEENTAKVAAALREFGLDIPDVSPELFADPNTVVQFGHPPFRIDLLTDLSGLSFDECYERRVVDTLEDIEVSVLGLSDLQANKRAVGRSKDLEDLKQLPQTDSRAPG